MYRDLNWVTDYCRITYDDLDKVKEDFNLSSFYSPMYEYVILATTTAMDDPIWEIYQVS